MVLRGYNFSSSLGNGSVSFSFFDFVLGKACLAALSIKNYLYCVCDSRRLQEMCVNPERLPTLRIYIEVE